ncbi:MAG: DUF3298 and DUF4163 domain-containing protein [Marinilabiliaceae bacterium]|nr:DUF3298 and DUF4163 domain-containing protein [Marinilabiliaceae bacterium]
MVKHLILGLTLVIITIGCQTKTKQGFDYSTVQDSLVFKTDIYDINAQFPKFNHAYTDSLIRSTVLGMIQAFKEEAGEERLSENWMNEQVIQCELVYTTQGFLSIVFRDYHYTGGAHGNTFLTSLVLHPNRRVRYKLQDFFATSALQSVQKPVREQLRQQLDSDVFIDEGTATLADFKVFVITDQAIDFHFPPYQVAAYAFGAPVVKISQKSLNGFRFPE